MIRAHGALVGGDRLDRPQARHSWLVCCMMLDDCSCSRLPVRPSQSSRPYRTSPMSITPASLFWSELRGSLPRRSFLRSPSIMTRTPATRDHETWSIGLPADIAVDGELDGARGTATSSRPWHGLRGLGSWRVRTSISRPLPSIGWNLISDICRKCTLTGLFGS